MYSSDTEFRTHSSPKFSLMFFASNAINEMERGRKYDLVMQASKFADEQEFEAVWIPERHFHPFGGLFPNPSVLGAALSVHTSRLRIRAGSVVLPLHQPLRVAEEWSLVDNLSEGRVDLAFTQGWAPQDFVLAPDAYANRLSNFYSRIELVRNLWRGNTTEMVDGNGRQCTIQIYPQPAQSDLNVWITCSGPIERFIEAGAKGFNVLTALLFQSVEELGKKLNAYREARAAHGHDPLTGHVTLMLHTFVSENEGEVREIVRAPFIEYMKTSVNLWQQFNKGLAELDERNQEKLLAYAFERYYKTAALFGTPDSCLPMVAALHQAGVNEIACLSDFGLAKEVVLKNLTHLNSLREMSQSMVESCLV